MAQLASQTIGRADAKPISPGEPLRQEVNGGTRCMPIAIPSCHAAKRGGRPACRQPVPTSGGALKRRRSIRLCRNNWRPSLPTPKRKPARACRCLSKMSSRLFLNAVFWRTDSCACAVRTARTRSWWRFRASAAGFAPRAARGAWPRALRTWSTRGPRRCRSGNGCCRCRSRAARARV